MGTPLSWSSRIKWPKLDEKNHTITSDVTPNYNCIAWAYEISNKKMWPGVPDYYWPSDASASDELAAIIQLYLDAGYERCEKGDLESGYKKVAIYTDQDGPQHAALQLESGKWTSKLGKLQDIEHDSTDDLEGELYGKVSVFLKKRRG